MTKTVSSIEMPPVVIVAVKVPVVGMVTPFAEVKVVLVLLSVTVLASSGEMAVMSDPESGWACKMSLSVDPSGLIDVQTTSGEPELVEALIAPKLPEGLAAFHLASSSGVHSSSDLAPV